MHHFTSVLKNITFFYFLSISSISPATLPSSSSQSEAILGEGLSEDGTIITLYGIDKDPDPAICELLTHPVMERLKHVDQSGPPRYHGYTPPFSRYGHSLGVYYLSKKFGASRAEQVAGLLHDASHTAFSHLADTLFFGGEKSSGSFQDHIHLWHLEEAQVDKVLHKHGLTLKDMDLMAQPPAILKKSLPCLCMDRIEYTIRTGYLFGLITQKEAQAIVAALRFENNTWYFVNQVQALKFANLSLYFCENLFGASFNLAIYHWYAQILQHAFDKGYLTKNDMLFGRDEVILDRLRATNDPYILTRLAQSDKVHAHHQAVEAEDTYHVWSKIKFRGVNPLVKKDGKLVRLTTLDPDFKQHFEMLKNKQDQGAYLRFIPLNKAL